MVDVVGEDVVIVGGGVGGLFASLALARAGHRVTLLERDEIVHSDSAEDAFAAERRGAPQVHQTHGFLARIAVEMRRHFPDVMEALLSVGCTTLPMTANLGEPRPGDEDLAVLVVRRTTLEWVVRDAVEREPLVTVLAGQGVRSLAAERACAGEPPMVTGVELDDGTTIEADIVIAATGRRGRVPEWLAGIGVSVDEKVVESGLMYISRWYRLPEGFDLSLDAKLGGDLGFVKYLAVPGDGNTLSITLAVRPDDSEVRSALSTPEGFEAACRALPGPDLFFRHGPLEPIGGVRPMGGLLNRLRRFVDADGAPVVLGFHAIGDAHTCTNPLYGRGCSLAVVQALLLADAISEHPGDDAGRARAYESACAREVEPWFDVSVQMDKAGADPAGTGAFGGGGGEASAESRGLAAVFAAAATDPILGRGIARFMNLLATPLDLMGDAEFLGRVAAVMADPDSVPIPPREGPSRRQLLEALAPA